MATASVVERYRAQRQKSRAWVIAGLVLAGLAVGAMAGVAFWQSGSPLVAAIPASGPEGKIRAWIVNDLRENSHSGDTAYEVVRWFDYERKPNDHWGRQRVKYRVGRGADKYLRDEWFIFDERTGEMVEQLAHPLPTGRTQYPYTYWYEREYWGTRQRDEHVAILDQKTNEELARREAGQPARDWDEEREEYR